MKDEINNKYKKGSLYFLKKEIKVYDIRTSIVRKIATKHFKKLSKKEIISICKELMRSNYNEKFTIETSFLFKISNQFEKF